MSTLLKVLLGLALVVPMGAYVVGSLVASSADPVEGQTAVVVPAPLQERVVEPGVRFERRPTPELRPEDTGGDDADDDGGADDGGADDDGGTDDGAPAPDGGVEVVTPEPQPVPPPAGDDDDDDDDGDDDDDDGGDDDDGDDD